ncbi:disease resistance protein RPS5-like [Gastrolobium bilobum]|uniref:disease resistance protein RPS5-like n=1 Tax=Gastrolobium bilobum TaxID=150636 RepID=UPI002AB0E7E9|nr:disease resistance protein RPS5-like [Gastrolobium bilobum]
MEVVGVLWEVASCLFSCGNVHAAYVYKLEKNLESLQRKWVNLQSIRKDLHRRIDDAEETGEMKRTEEVNGWLEKVQNLQKVMEEIQNQGSQETHNKCLSGCCPKNCVSSYKLGKRVMDMLKEVDGLLEKRFVDITCKVECLGEQEAFELFCEMVGEETLSSHQDIRKLAREMAKECKGLPLALVTVGRAMSGVKSVAAWSQAIHDLTRSYFIHKKLEEDVFHILKLSYDRLPNETHKSCFLYCALYPEDYEVEVKDLIDRWIGEGFLGKGRMKKSIYDMYEEGESIIEKLKLSRLLEGVEDYRNGTFRIKMHDVIRDMALWLARDEDGNKDKVVVEGEALGMSEMDFERLNDVERISIINAASGSWQVPSCPNLLTLCVKADNMSITDYSNLESMTKLKVLDLSGNYVVYILTEIKELMSFEYLNLSGAKFGNGLQIVLKNCKKLRVLLMENVDSIIISLEEIASLEQLKVFRLSYRSESTRAEEEKTLIEKLECLPKLEELCIQLTTTAGLRKLLESNKLRDCLRRFLLHSITSLDMASFLASLSKMKHLEWVELFGIENIMESSSIADIFHLCKLRHVQIRYCHSITHLTWLRYAPLLEYLRVFSCGSIEEVVKEAEDDRDNSNDIFPNLKTLHLSNLGKLNSIYKRALAFPSLKHIGVYHCPKLRKLPLNSNSAKDSLITIKGESEWWNNLEWDDVAVKDLLQSKFQSYDVTE